MNGKRSIRAMMLLGCLWALVAPGRFVAAGELRRVNVLIVRDGASPFHDQKAAMLKRELRVLTEGEWDLHFIQGPEWTGNWESGAMGVLLEKAFAEPDADVIFGTGVLLAQEVLRYGKPLPKPVVSGFVEDPTTIGMPLGEGNTSAIPNYTFVMVPGSAQDDVDFFQTVFPFKNLAVLVDAYYLKYIPELTEQARTYQKHAGIMLELVAIRDDAESTLKGIPADVDAVYLTPSVILPEAEKQKLIDGLIKRKLPSFSMLGREDVVKGVMAGQRTGDLTQIVRRLALNIQQIMMGTPADQLPVMVDAPTRPVLNARTARQVGVDLPYTITMVGDILHIEDMEIGEKLNLADAFERALAASPALAVAREETAASLADHHRARSSLFPQVGLNAQYVEVDNDRARASMGMQPRRITSGGMALSQIVFHDPAITGFRMSSRAYQAQRYEQAVRELDVFEQVANAYINLLARRALLLIDLDNQALIQRYLDLARSRHRSGVAGQEEVYRWEGQLTSARSAMLSSLSQLSIAQTLLNQAMGTDLNAVWNPADADELAVHNRHFDPAFNMDIQNDRQLAILQEFLLEMALGNSPELRALDFAIEAQELAVSQYKRRFILPEVAVQAGMDHTFDKTEAGGDEPLPFPLPEAKDDSWQVAVVASWPIFEGGGKRADLRKAEAERNRLKALRLQTKQAVEQRVLDALLSISSSDPNIELTRTAAELARKNLAIVQEKYARGVLPIVELLDAQTDTFVQEQRASLAVYQFMQDVVRGQRAVGFFPERSSSGERERHFAEFSRVVEQAREVKP